MTATILDGKATATAIKAELAGRLVEMGYDARSRSVVVRYEFFKYQGTFDGEGLVDPTAAETPTGNALTPAVGNYVGEQIAGFNAVQGAVPEPSTYLLMLAGLSALALIRRRAVS